MTTPITAPPIQVPHKPNVLAIVGFCLALAPILLVFVPVLRCFGFLCPIAGIVLGIIALTQINKPGVAQGGKGLAIAAIVIGGLWLIIVPILAVLGLAILGPTITNVFGTISQTLSAPTP